MTPADLRLFGDRVLVRLEPRPTMLAGLHVPETVVRDNHNYFRMTGTVVAVGDGVREHDYECAHCGYQYRRAGESDGDCPICTYGLRGPNAILLKSHELKPLTVQPGDRVLFNQFTGRQVELDGERHLIMREWEILAVLDPEHDVLPGYNMPTFGRVTDGTAPPELIR